MRLSKSDTTFLKSQGVARLATASSEGTPHNIPVCPLVDRGKVYFASETNARKMKNLRANPRATIVFDVYRDSWRGLRGLMLVCTARIVDEAEFKKIRRKLYKQYPKYESAAPLGPEDSVIVELTPQNKFGWAMG
jgi:nitroimidazol reductase NimA-like FMN-containing flavoprotein (pyridoxamine 5'-phosphate oxidase superfamily)